MPINLAELRERAKQAAGSGFTQSDRIWSPSANLQNGENATLILMMWDSPNLHLPYFMTTSYQAELVDPKTNGIIRVYIPSVKNYDYSQKCPIQNYLNGIYSEIDNLKLAGHPETVINDYLSVYRKHRARRSMICQGFVIDRPDVDPKKLMLIRFSNQFFRKISDPFPFIYDHTPTYEWDSTMSPFGFFTVEDLKKYVELGGNVDPEFQKAFSILPFGVRRVTKGQFPNYESSDWRFDMGWQMLPVEMAESVVENGGFIDPYKELGMPEPTVDPNTGEYVSPITDEQMEAYLQIMIKSVERAFGRDPGYWDESWEKAGIRKPNPKPSVDGGVGNTGVGVQPSSPMPTGSQTPIPPAQPPSPPPFARPKGVGAATPATPQPTAPAMPVEGGASPQSSPQPAPAMSLDAIKEKLRQASVADDIDDDIPF